MTKQQFSSHEFTAKDGFHLPYRMYRPTGDGPHPLLICFHGAGERGRDNEIHLDYFLPIFSHPHSPAMEAITILPQCPQEMRWVEYNWDKGSYQSEPAQLSSAFHGVEQLIECLLAMPEVDNSRVYVTGLSMGGFATWRMMAEHPEWFAAGMPICGGGALDKAKALADIPIRTFHCKDDPVVPVTATRDIVYAVKAAGKDNLAYMEYSGVGHGVWSPVYDDLQNIHWLFSQCK